jgi:hypothetical protein
MTNDFLATMPGASDLYLTAEREFRWGTSSQGGLQYLPIVIVSTAVDTGTPTTTLRKGLCMGKITSSGKYKEYSPTATDGSEIPIGFLLADVNMLDASATAVDRVAVLLVAGPVRAAQVLPTITQNMRKHLHPRFLFDDDLPGNKSPWRQTVAKTADYTVVAGTDNGKVFITTGDADAIVFTLPAVGASIIGERYKFIQVTDNNMTITAPANKLIIFNNATATSGVFSTAGNKIGAICEVYANDAGTFWIFEQQCKHTLTVA